MGKFSPWPKKKWLFDIAPFNAKKWMVQVLDLIGKFIIFFTACDYLQNSRNASDFPEKFPMGKSMGKFSPWGNRQKKHHVLNISEYNTEMWMVQVVDIVKAFIILFTACYYLQNWMSTIKKSEKVPHGEIRWGNFPLGEKVKKKMTFRYRTL